MTKNEALKTMEKFANQPKRTYVRVADRRNEVIEVEGGFKLEINTRVYSKTWSKTFSTLFIDGVGHLSINHARKYLQA